MSTLDERAETAELRAALEAAQAEAAEYRRALDQRGTRHKFRMCNCNCCEEARRLLDRAPGSRDALDAREEAAFHGGHAAGVRAVLDALLPGIDEPVASVALAGGFPAAEAFVKWKAGR